MVVLSVDEKAGSSHNNIPLVNIGRDRKGGHRKLIHVPGGVFATRSSIWVGFVLLSPLELQRCFRLDPCSDASIITLARLSLALLLLLPPDSLVEVYHHHHRHDTAPHRLHHLHALARHCQPRHLHTPAQRIANPIFFHQTLLSFSDDGNVVSAARSLQDCLEPEADSRRLFNCSLHLHHPGFLHKHQRRRPRQLFDPQRRSAQRSECETQAQGEEQGFLPTCG